MTTEHPAAASIRHRLEGSASMSEDTIQRSAEEAAVRGLYQRFMDAWNRGSGADLAAVFTPDGDLVGFDGTHLKGRQVIAAHNQRLFDKWLRGTRLVGQVTDLRFLGPDVAVMHAVGGTVLRGKRAPSPERDSIQTLVATRTGGAWQLAAFQNTRLRRMSENPRPFLLWTLSDWLWKVARLNKPGAYPYDPTSARPADAGPADQHPEGSAA
jgi:uncharacterized protein (TIGR02246 family)